MLVLTLTAQFTVPVCDAQVVVYHALTVSAVLQHRVEERLRAEGWRGRQHEETRRFTGHDLVNFLTKIKKRQFKNRNIKNSDFLYMSHSNKNMSARPH